MRIIRHPRGAVAYDASSGMTIRFTEDEARMALPGYEPTDDVQAPEAVHLEVMDRCNLACSYCYAPQGSSSPPLTTAEWERVIHELAELGTFQLTLGGGEPLLNPDVVCLARVADACGLNVTLTTNGLLLPDVNTQDLRIFRQVNVSYHRSAMENGFNLGDALRRLNNAGIACGISFIMIEENKPAFREVCERAKEHHALLLLLSFKPVKENSGTALSHGVIHTVAHRLAQRGVKVALDSLACSTCKMNESVWTISAAGDVHPCSFVRESLGNVRHASVAKIWQKRGAQRPCPFPC